MATQTFNNRSTKAEILEACKELAAILGVDAPDPGSTKPEILAVYDLLAKDFKKGARAAKRATVEPVPTTATLDEQEVFMPTGPASIETIIQDLAGIRSRLGESVGALQQQLLGEATRLQSLRAEAEEHTSRLRALHGIEVDDETLRGRVCKYQETQKSADESYAARLKGWEVAIEASKATWRKEQDEHARASKETEDASQRARKREATEYGYEIERVRKADADALAQSRKQLQAGLDMLNEQHERSWAEREKDLGRREQDYAELQAQAAAAPKDLESSIARAEAEGTGIAKRQARITADLQQKTNDGKRRVYELRVQALDETIVRQNEQIGELSKQLATALKQAQDLAIKAIDGASNASSFAAVKEIALEQAKTSQKTK